MQEKAKKLVAEYINGLSETEQKVKPEDIFVVWFCKTLKNWKCILSTMAVKGYLFELSYNGEKDEIYFDSYRKENNFVVKD